MTPRHEGGSDLSDNIVIACQRCNRNKGGKTTAFDRVTGLWVPLFNPLKDRWQDHFEIVAGHTVGITVVGRATAGLLFNRLPQEYPSDTGWYFIQDINDENLYHFLNHQRARRLANEFGDLTEALSSNKLKSLIRQVNEKDKERARFAIQLLWAEIFSMRCRVQDLRKGIPLVARLRQIFRDTLQLQELYKLQSIMSQQLATLYSLKGDPKGAKRLQKQSSDMHVLSIKDLRFPGFVWKLRERTIAAKYYGSPNLLYGQAELRQATQMAQDGNLFGLTYVADAELCNLKSGSRLEEITAAVEDALKIAGYGQDFDIPRAVVLRRRWWPLRLISGEEVNLDLLADDLRYWKSIQMRNEIQELKLSLKRVQHKSSPRVVASMIHVIDKEGREIP